jgi:xenotropic and polytropic retrovirus receptor 1
MSLSLFRINKTPELKALFIFCASVNALYCTFWDLVMDWSLLDPTSKPNRFLRDTLAYKQVWLYYTAIVIDPILRFNWILYAVYADDVQHSAVLSFFVSFSEVLRRGLWMLIRVENEHCTNVGRFRASRDIPLPYEVQQATPAGLQDHEPQRVRHSGDRKRPGSNISRTTTRTQAHTDTDVESQNVDTTPLSPQTSKTSGANISRQATAGTSGSRPSTLRWRSWRSGGPSPLIVGLQRVGTALHLAHAQDFQRKKRPEVGEVVEDSDEGEDLEVQSGYCRKIEEENGSAMVEPREGGDTE